MTRSPIEPAAAIGRRAMVLAAGRGLRMRPLTDSVPKPLVKLAGRPLIDHAVDRLAAAGVETVVVNIHHLANQMEEWAHSRTAPTILLSDERDFLLDTGGGAAKALPHLGRSPFFVVNSDSLWVDGPAPALDRMRRLWSDQAMDALLLLSPITHAVGYCGPGDFELHADGRLARRPSQGSAPFVFAGCSLIAPRLFAGAPASRFSLNLLWDRAIAAGRLYGVRHDGLWLHVGTPEAIDLAERALLDGRWRTQPA